MLTADFYRLSLAAAAVSATVLVEIPERILRISDNGLFAHARTLLAAFHCLMGGLHGPRSF
jgi:hypothetical protein